MNLEQFTQDTLNNEGATYNLTTGEGLPKTGYMVSIYPELEEQVKVDALTVEVVRNFVKKVAEKLTISTFLGSWTDKGIVYLDLSEHIVDKYEAIWLGILRGQKSILDIDNDTCISLPSPQTSGTLYQQLTYAQSKAREMVGYNSPAPIY